MVTTPLATKFRSLEADARTGSTRRRGEVRQQLTDAAPAIAKVLEAAELVEAGPGSRKLRDALLELEQQLWPV